MTETAIAWRPRAMALVAFTLLLPALAASAVSDPPPASPPPAAAASPADADRAPAPRLREGALVETVRGQFESNGTRFAFQTRDGQARYVLLENLQLERVARMLEENPAALDWTVSGRITEYRGANFLLLSRAVVHAGEPAPAKPPSRRAGLTPDRGRLAW